jgi:hypothetical protein
MLCAVFALILGLAALSLALALLPEPDPVQALDALAPPGAQIDPNTANNTATEDTRIVQQQPTPTPEASTLLLLGSSLASLAGYAGLRLRARRLGQRPSPNPQR